MKNCAIYFFLKLLGLVFVFAMLPFFGYSQETEPNNTVDQANLLTLNSTITASIGEVGDVDWFQVTIPEEGTLKFVSSGVDINDYYLKLVDVDGATILDNTEVYPLGDVDSVFKTNLQAGDYYVQVSFYSSNTGTYTLTNSFVAALYPNDQEPNDSFEEAQFFPLNTNTTGRLNYVYQGVGDGMDWYQITIPEEGTLSVATTGADINDYFISLVDVDGAEVLHSKEVYPLGDVDSVYKTNLMAGTYYVKLSNYSSNHGSYSLSNLFTPAILANDNEPNDTYEQAQVFPLNTSTTGRINYSYDGVADMEDWFKIEIPEEGTLKVRVTSPDNNDFYTKLYDVDGTTILSSAEVYPLGEVDSVYKTNLQAGIYFVKISPYSGNHGSYSLTNVFIPAILTNDLEPNNTFEQAQEFIMNSETTGRLNYVYDDVADASDWFTITIPEEGTLKVISTSPDNNDYYIKLFNVDGTTMLQTSEVYPLGDVDSVYKTNLQAGQYYVQVYAFTSNHGSYFLENEFIPALLPADEEPNNTVELAKEFPLDSQTTGRINYLYDGVADDADWFKITIPEEGTLKVISTSPDNNDYYINLIDVNAERVLKTKEVYPLGDVDSVYQANLQAGTYYLKVSPYSSNHGSYTITNVFIPALLPGDDEPNNTFEQAVSLEGDTILTGRLNYVYDTEYDNKDWFKITLPENGGLKVTSNSPDNNDYYIRLVAPDGHTEISSINIYQFATRSIYGWELVAGETYYIMVYPYSSYFGSYNLEVSFQPAPASSFTFEQNMTNVLFTNTSKYGISYAWDFGDGSTSTLVNPSHEYTSPGVFEVSLTATNPNGSHEYEGYVEYRGIQKVEGKHGGNGGLATVTVFAGGLNNQSVPILKMGDKEIEGQQIIFPKIGQIQAIYDLKDKDLGVYDVIIRNPGEPEMVLEQAYTIEEAIEPDVYVELNGRTRALINRWSTWTVEFGNRGNTDAYYQILWIAVPDSVEFKNLVFDLDVYDDPEAQAYLADCPPYWELDTLGDAPFQGRLYGIPFNKVPADSKFTIEMKIKAVDDFQVSAFTTTPWFTEDDFSETMSYNECVGWAIATMIRDKLVEQLTGLLPGADCVYGSVKTLSEVSLQYAEGKLAVSSLAWSVSQVVWTCLKDLGQNIPWVKALKISKVMVDLTVDVVNCYNSDQDCQQYKIKDKKIKYVAAVTSLDPNEIVGPEGYTEDHFIKEQETTYTVYFENQATATSNAVEVFVYDTLNIASYNLESFRFEKIWIAGTFYDVVMDNNDFAMDVDLRPGINTIVRIRGSFDPVSAVAFWHFMSLDPATMDITEDPEGGFLPPNTEKPNGEGFVSYSINLNPSLVNNDDIEAKATIVFDFNQPIETNLFVNTIDLQHPVSSVYDIQAVGDNELYEVFWQGTDAGAGINYYNVYRSVAGGEFSLWLNNTAATSDTMTAIPGTTYSFFCQAIDNLENEEPYKGYAEQVLGIGDQHAPESYLEIIPNPAVNLTHVKYYLSEQGEVDIFIYNSTGKKVYSVSSTSSVPGEFEQQINVSGFPAGIYSVILRNGRYSSTGKMVVQH